jgi:hypothetical protein
MTNNHGWNYIGQTGKVALIALQHDTLTGDLLIFYDKELLWAERGVRGAQVISFFADDELCRIHVEPTGNKLSYQFEIDRDENTPLNKIKRTEERNNWIKSFLFLAAIIASLAAFIGGGYLLNQYSDEKNLRENGINTTAKFTTSYGFSHKKPLINGLVMMNNIAGFQLQIKLGFVGDSLALPCGLPAYSDDEFAARYDPDELTNMSVNLEEPAIITILVTPKQRWKTLIV